MLSPHKKPQSPSPAADYNLWTAASQDQAKTNEESYNGKDDSGPVTVNSPTAQKGKDTAEGHTTGEDRRGCCPGQAEGTLQRLEKDAEGGIYPHHNEATDKKRYNYHPTVEYLIPNM